MKTHVAEDTHQLYSLSRKGNPYYRVYDSSQNEIFVFRRPSTRIVTGVNRICGRLSSSDAPNIEVSIFKNVVGNGGSMEIRQTRDGSHLTSYQQAIAPVPTMKVFITLKLKSSDIELVSNKEKYIWKADERTLFQATDKTRLLAAKIVDADLESEGLSVLINVDIIQPHIAICFMFLREY